MIRGLELLDRSLLNRCRTLALTPTTVDGVAACYADLRFWQCYQVAQYYQVPVQSRPLDSAQPLVAAVTGSLDRYRTYHLVSGNTSLGASVLSGS